MDDFDYDRMVQDNLSTITRVRCRRNSTKACYDGKLLTESVYNYHEDGESDSMEQCRSNYLSDGTLADDGSIVCDACYVGF